jgi:hypothetical protein
MVFGSGGGSAGEEDFDFFAFGLEFCCRLEERFLAFAVEFNSADGADDKVVRCESVGAAGGVAFVRGDGRKFGEIDSVVEDFDFFGWRELGSDGAGDAENLSGEGEDVSGVGFPKRAKFLEPIADVPDVRDAGETGGHGGVANHAGVCVDEGDVFFVEYRGEGKRGWQESQHPLGDAGGAQDWTSDDAELWKKEGFDFGFGEQFCEGTVFGDKDEGLELRAVQPLRKTQEGSAGAVDVRAVVDKKDFFQSERGLEVRKNIPTFLRMLE